VYKGHLLSLITGKIVCSEASPNKLALKLKYLMMISLVSSHLDPADPELEVEGALLIAGGHRLRLQRLLALCQHGDLEI